jgi:hypothetical protein
MGAALHVLATLVVVPYVILAIGFVLLGHSIASGSLLSLFDRLLNHFLWIVPWGLIGFACAMLLVAVLGVVPGFRRIGALCLFALAGASLAIILFTNPSPPDASQMLFLLPCICVLVLAAWRFFATANVALPQKSARTAGVEG